MATAHLDNSQLSTPRSTHPRRWVRAIGLTAALAVASVGAASCSAESLAEKGIEQLIESELGAEISGDVDFEMGENGSISITTEEGSMVIDTDGEDSTFRFEVDGQVSEGTIDDSGVGTTTLTDADGQTTTSHTTHEAPSDWPEFIFEPEGLNRQRTIYTQIASPDGAAMSATFEHDPGKGYGNDLLDRLVAEGFEIVSQSSSEDAVYFSAQHEGLNLAVQATNSDGDGFTFVAVGPAN